jgi:hypothetical protein
MHIRELVKEYKTKRGCRICGTKTRPLAFHHKHCWDKVDNVSIICNSLLKEEMGKCVILCNVCHCRWHVMYGLAKHRFPDFETTLLDILLYWQSGELPVCTFDNDADDIKYRELLRWEHKDSKPNRRVQRNKFYQLHSSPWRQWRCSYKLTGGL